MYLTSFHKPTSFLMKILNRNDSKKTYQSKGNLAFFGKPQLHEITQFGNMGRKCPISFDLRKHAILQ